MTWLDLRVSRVVSGVVVLALMLASFTVANAQSGVWATSGGGTYSGTGNWQDGIVANGAGNTADFSTRNISGDATVTFDSSRTLGHLAFGDTDLDSAGVWTMVETGGSVLTLNNGASAPTITANPLTPLGPAFDDTYFDIGLAGTNGFTKLGSGTLTLDGNRNTISGTVNVIEGTLRLGSSFIYSEDGSTPIAQTINQFNLGNGATLSTAGAISNVAVANNATATLNITAGSVNVTELTAAGPSETLNLNVALGNVTVTAGANWTGFENLNITGQTVGSPGFLRLVPNNSFGGAPPATNTASFANTRLHLDNMTTTVRTNSQGNTVEIGQLSGTSTAALNGGNAGTAARYQIGGLNTDSEFAGTINGAGGISINKIGTGTLTLSGNFNGSGALTNQIAARQGGVVRVTAGTLAITGASFIPGGSGTTLTTIDVLSGATFDVSGAPSTFSTSNLQKIQGSGTIVGPYNHDEGFIRPGDVASATAANEGNLSSGVVPTAGTINFSGPLSFNGGTIIYDMSTNPAAGNDLIQVTGVTNLSGGGVVDPNFLAGEPAVGLTYTVLSSSGGFGGSSPTGWTVDWPGRGAKPALFTNGNLLQFTTTPIAGNANLIWSGAQSGSWDVETSQNWTNGGSPDVYFQGDNVTFSQAGTNKNVTLNTVMMPQSVTVDSTSDYSIAGTGNISGTTTFTKRGSSTLTMQTSNNFSGAAAIEGGTVNIGASNGALGTGALTMAGGSIVTTAGGLTNASLAIATGTVNTIQVDGAGGSGSTFGIPTLSGDGELTITTTVGDKWFAMGNTGGFTGVLNLGPADPNVTGASTVRFNGDLTTFPNAVLNLSGVSFANQVGGTGSRTIAIGELHGDALSFLDGFTGGSAAPNAVFQVGALNTNSDFAGAIIDGAGGGGSVAVVGVTKVGSGSLTLTGPNTYTGDTRIEGGTLSISQANPASTGDIYISTGGIFNLNFAGTDVVDSLFLNNQPQAVGTWGRLNHPTADFTSAFFTGEGLLQVSTLGIAPGLPGDYNGDGTVDAADYTVWRNNLGGDGAALEPGSRDPMNGGVINTADYDFWKANYGNSLPGSGGLAAAVPEPAAWCLMASAVAAAGLVRRRWQSLPAIS